MTLQHEQPTKHILAANTRRTRITLDQYEEEPSIVLDKIRRTPSTQPRFPVGSGQAIRLRQRRRSGYRPLSIEVELQIVGERWSYTDFEVELRVVARDGERSLGLLPLPEQAGGRVRLAIPQQGSLVVYGDQRLACVLRNRSQASTLTGAYVGVGFRFRGLLAVA